MNFKQQLKLNSKTTNTLGITEFVKVNSNKSLHVIERIAKKLQLIYKYQRLEVLVNKNEISLCLKEF